MKFILNNLFKSKYFNKLPIFFGKKLIKYSKYFFVETTLKELPLNNHPLNINYINEISKIKNLHKSNFFIPFISYSHLIDLLEIYSNYKKNISFFDYGAGDLNLYFTIKKKIKSLKYYYYDQTKYVDIVRTIKNKKKLSSLFIAEKKKCKRFRLCLFWKCNSILARI